MIDYDEQQFLAALAEECRCCERCQVSPCAGLTMGAFCDRQCSCYEDSDFEWEDTNA